MAAAMEQTATAVMLAASTAASIATIHSPTRIAIAVSAAGRTAVFTLALAAIAGRRHAIPTKTAGQVAAVAHVPAAATAVLATTSLAVMETTFLRRRRHAAEAATVQETILAPSAEAAITAPAVTLISAAVLAAATAAAATLVARLQRRAVEAPGRTGRPIQIGVAIVTISAMPMTALPLPLTLAATTGLGRRTSKGQAVGNRRASGCKPAVAELTAIEHAIVLRSRGLGRSRRRFRRGLEL